MYIWCPSIRKQDGHLMDGFRYETQKVPKGIRILAIGLWISFLSMDEIGKLARIPDEKYWRVVSNHIPIAFLGIKL